MDRYVAFLRGMNLGGRRITNDDLRAHFEALGCVEVATFRASGNVVFAVDDEKPAALTERLEAGLGEQRPEGGGPQAGDDALDRR